MARYATGEDLVTFYDRRRISQLIGDSGTAVPPASVQNHPVVEAMLVAASDEISAAASVGKRYVEAELVDLAAQTGGGGPLLRQLTCHLCYGLIVNRRGLAAEDQEKLTPYWRWAQSYLDMIRKGERVFGGITGVLDAGLPTTESMAVPQPGIMPPSIVQGAGRIFGVGPVVSRGYPGYRG